MFCLQNCIRRISERTDLDVCELQRAGMYCVTGQHIIFL